MHTADNQWLKLANHPDDFNFGANNIAVIEIGGRPICVAKFDNEIFAFTATCPHAGGYLGAACINEKGHIVCPVHHYKFNIRNGHNVSGEGYRLKYWPVVIRKDGVFVKWK